jgi:hypothetical protein
MVLQKTDKGVACLQARSGEPGLRDRHVLILADGRRTASDIAAALGGDAERRIERLLASGHLAVFGARASTGAPVASGARPVPDVSIAPAHVPKRSLAAARLYLLDMLRLQRGWEAEALARAIQRTAQPTYQVPAMLDALRHLLAVTKPSYGQRVGSQVLALMPEEFVSRVRAVLDGPPPARLSA